MKMASTHTSKAWTQNRWELLPWSRHRRPETKLVRMHVPSSRASRMMISAASITDQVTSWMAISNHELHCRILNFTGWVMSRVIWAVQLQAWSSWFRHWIRWRQIKDQVLRSPTIPLHIPILQDQTANLLPASIANKEDAWSLQWVVQSLNMFVPYVWMLVTINVGWDARIFY